MVPSPNYIVSLTNTYGVLNFNMNDQNGIEYIGNDLSRMEFDVAIKRECRRSPPADLSVS